MELDIYSFNHVLNPFFISYYTITCEKLFNKISIKIFLEFRLMQQQNLCLNYLYPCCIHDMHQ